MLRPFLTFTKTDATRLYNRAETKNIVINYLQQHGFIKEINGLFLSSSPTKKSVKYEVGFIKLFPTTKSASDATVFEQRLREKLGITFDDYFNKTFNSQNATSSTIQPNNMFNTANNNWLLNRCWYDKLRDGYISEYYQNKVLCPDENMSLNISITPSLSDDQGKWSMDKSMILIV